MGLHNIDLKSKDDSQIPPKNSFPALISRGSLLFLFGGRAIHEFGNVERVLAEVLGLAMPAALFFCGFMANSAVKDLEWEEASEEGIQEESELRCGRK